MPYLWMLLAFAAIGTLVTCVAMMGAGT